MELFPMAGLQANPLTTRLDSSRVERRCYHWNWLRLGDCQRFRGRFYPTRGHGIRENRKRIVEAGSPDFRGPGNFGGAQL